MLNLDITSQEKKEREAQVQAANVTQSTETNLALLLHEKWLNKILNEGKTWEIRGRNTNIRGKIYLAFKDHIYGETTIIDSFPVTRQQLQDNIDKHHVDDLSIIKYKTPHIWKLQNSIKYQQRLKLPRKCGQVVWVKVDFNSCLQIDTQEITEHEPDLSKRLTDIEWNELHDTNLFACCNKKVGGLSVYCDTCDGEWHIYIV